MSRLVASAPGKLLLAGEYAVLDGAPAIAMAMDRRAVVTVGVAPGANTVTVAGDAEAGGTFDAGRGTLAWRSGGERLRLFEAVWTAAAVPAQSPLEFLLDTRGFRDPDSDTKYGLGSSAALAVALAAALGALGGRDARDAAPEAHRHFQGGRGSGVDVACSLTGGLIEYRMPASSPRLEWPAGVAIAVLWSGRAADTRTMLDRLGAQPRRSSRRALADAAESLLPAFRQGDPGAILDSLRRYTDALARFDVDHQLGIFDAGHGTMVRAAAEFDVVYKPCGAGGGDAGIALSADPAALRAFIDFAPRHGFRELDVGIDSRGAVVAGDAPA